MDEIFGSSIKELIVRYPEVGTVLNDFGIACVTCAVGTCLLKDILDIHPLSPEDEQDLMTRIAGLIYPGQKIVIPRRTGGAAKAEAKALSYSPPLQELVNEHKLIKRLLAVLPAMLRSLDLDTEAGCQMAMSSVDFIRSFADKYHHAKEEDILFKYFDENLDILRVMHMDHETGRAHVRAVLTAVKLRNTVGAVTHLKAYRDLLTEHITKEDEILYPWMDRQLSDSQIGRLFAAFREVDEQFSETRRRCEALVTTLEHRFGQAEPARESGFS